MDLNNITINIQSSIRIEGSKILYFDPFRIETENHDADIIFVTHEHFDHFDPQAISNIKKDNTVLIAPLSMKKKIINEAGISDSNCYFYEPNNQYELDGIKIETIPAYNKLKPFHPKHNKWLGYNVNMDGITYFVSGDTDVTDDIKKVKCDIALIPIGGGFTMDKKQAAEYILELKPKAVIPTHYGEVVGDKADGEGFKALVEEKNSEILVELKL